MRALQFITDHVTFKLHYNQIYQMKTTQDTLYGDMHVYNYYSDGWDPQSYPQGMFSDILS